MAVKEAQSGLEGVLEVAVRFDQQDATVRYLPERVALAQILARYDDTPFDVSLPGAVVSITRAKQVTVRGWSARQPAAESTAEGAAKEGPAEGSGESLVLVVELQPATGVRLTPDVELSLADERESVIRLVEEFQAVVLEPAAAAEAGSGRRPASRYRARAVESVRLPPGETTLPLRFRIPTLLDQSVPRTVEGTLGVVIRKLPSARERGEPPTGVALIGGSLELRLGHLCAQRGCVQHFHQSLQEVAGLAAVRPYPSRDAPRATVHLQAAQPLDVWGLRTRLRSCSVEAAGIVPRGLDAYTLRIELPRWRLDEQKAAEQCLVCRDRTSELLAQLPWVDQFEIAGGGINCRPLATEHDLVELLDLLVGNGIAPLAVWLLPAGAAMPKAVSPLLATAAAGSKHGGSNVHPVVEMHFGHTCQVGTSVLAVLSQRSWASRTHGEYFADKLITRAAIDDRKFANLALVFDELRSVGYVPLQTRLSGFGDLRIELEFAHICGEIEYSKPPKKAAAKSPQKTPADAKKSAAEPQQQKPFVPKPLRPAKSSAGRQAIEAAWGGVDWIQQGVFHDYHTQPEFTAPRKLSLSVQPNGSEAVRVDDLIQSLYTAGFPPQSVVVSRRFPGIPFGMQLPEDLQLTSGQGRRYSLASWHRPGKPLAVAFVSLNCPRHKKYKPDAKLYRRLAGTVDRFGDRVGFVAISANSEDRFADVVQFWQQTGLSVPLLHDADGSARRIFNAQVTPPPHMFVFDGQGRLRYAGEPHDKWQASAETSDDFLGRALELVLAGSYQANGAVFYNKSVCNCADPNCKCPKCGCGPTCRCTIKH